MSAAAICLGHPDRGDDAVGPLAAAQLRAAGATLLDCNEEPTRLIDAWAGLELVVIVDAVRSGAAPGTVHRFEAGERPLPPELGLAEHRGAWDHIALDDLERAPDRGVGALEAGRRDQV